MAKFLAERTTLIRPSPTLAISATAKAMKDAGKDVVSFGAGEPDFDTPEHIKAACKAALDRGETKYTAVAGTVALRQAIIQKFERDQGHRFELKQVTASDGGKQVLYNAFMALLNPGDEVIIPTPYWVSYPDMVRLAGGVPVFVRPQDQTHFVMRADEIAAAITPRTKVILINSPNNPSGSGLLRDELFAIAKLAVQRQLFLISDEIYEKLIYADFRFTSMIEFFKELPALQEHLLVAHGVAKTYSMTGWRVGYAAGPSWLLDAMNMIQGASTSHCTSFAQAGAAEALSGPQDSVEMMRSAFEKRAVLLVDLLQQIRGVRCTLPRGAFYVFPNFDEILAKGKWAKTDAELTSYLLNEHQVAVVPGGEFGAPGHLRLSFATSEEIIKKGAQRLKNALS